MSACLPPPRPPPRPSPCLLSCLLRLARLRFPWYDYHTKFLFKDAGGEAVWGNLESFLAVSFVTGNPVPPLPLSAILHFFFKSCRDFELPTIAVLPCGESRAPAYVTPPPNRSLVPPVPVGLLAEG